MKKALLIEMSCVFSINNTDIIINTEALESITRFISEGNYYLFLACGRVDNCDNMNGIAEYIYSLLEKKDLSLSGKVVERTNVDNIFSYPSSVMIDLFMFTAKSNGINSIKDVCFVGCKPVHREAAENAGCEYVDVNDLICKNLHSNH